MMSMLFLIASANLSPIAPADVLGPPFSILQVEISPEVRLSVRRERTSARAVDCSRDIPIRLEINNQSGARSPLRVRPEPDFINVGIIADLSGAAKEYRVMTLRTDHIGRLDVTLRFDAGPGTSDLAYRSETHFILQCSR